ncbi:hypothetical protein [Pseudoruegeria sp. HB172150]|uniref:hypothetical protein n=1 Tax=Pseudoruegeria sp. HB172150 TaxID=2721164 RepID=UPI0015536138|nr:hypothetical protein [Pseudoruegeria sp. HB172150]
MLLERTITSLQCRAESPERANELGKLGFLQWLAWLSPEACYPEETARALNLAEPFSETDPAIRAFCDLVRRSLSGRIEPLDLDLPERRRRGGAHERRRML